MCGQITLVGWQVEDGTPHRDHQPSRRNEQRLKLQVLECIKLRLRMLLLGGVRFWLWGGSTADSSVLLSHSTGSSKEVMTKDLLHGAMQDGLSRGRTGQL